jgi:hypothetical protein
LLERKAFPLAREGFPLSEEEIAAFLADPQAALYGGLGPGEVAQLRAGLASRLGGAPETTRPWWALNHELDRLQEFVSEYGRGPVKVEELPRRRALLTLAEVAASLRAEEGAALTVGRVAAALGLPGAEAGAQLEVAETGYDAGTCAVCKRGFGEEEPFLARFVARRGGRLREIEVTPHNEEVGFIRLVCASCGRRFGPPESESDDEGEGW